MAQKYSEMEVKIKLEHEKETNLKLEKFVKNFRDYKSSTSLLDMQKKLEKAVKQKE